MADLGKMFAKKPADTTKEGEKKDDSRPATSLPNPFGGIKKQGGDAAQPDSVSPAPEAEAAVSPDSAGVHIPESKSPKLAGIFGTAKPMGGAATGNAFAKLAKRDTSDSDAKPGSASSDGAEGSGVVGNPFATLDQLGDVEPVRDEPSRASFPDETPASAPTRELPDDISEAAKNFVQTIDGIYEIIHDSELLANVIPNIMIELQQNPQYIKLVVKQDIHTWVRAMRDGMGLARIKKTESKARRKAGSSKASDADVLSALDELGIDL